MLTDETFLEEYRTGTNNFVVDFYKKAFSHSIEYRRAVGYFRSSSLEAFGSTLQNFLRNDGKIRLISSVELTEADSNAIEEGMSKQEVCEKRIASIIEEEFQEGIGSGITKLAKLLEIGRLEIKIAIPQTGRGIYHEKVGLFFDESGNFLAFSGSANESTNAFENNYECIEVFTSWDDKSRAEKKREHFESLWNESNDDVLVFEFSEASKKNIIQKVKEFSPIVYDANLIESPNILGGYQKKNIPTIPSWLNLRDYQKEAINAWIRNQGKGLWAMATGSGKTITSLAGATHILNELDKYIPIVVDGNRRLIALKLLRSPSLAKINTTKIQKVLEETTYREEEIPCIVFNNKEEIIQHLGYKHITGIIPWNMLNKAKYLNSRIPYLKSKIFLKQTRELAKIIGSRSDYVKRILVGYKLYEMADFNENIFYFSYIIDALKHETVIQFLNINLDSEDPLENLDRNNFKIIIQLFLDKKSGALMKLDHLLDTNKISHFTIA